MKIVACIAIAVVAVVLVLRWDNARWERLNELWDLAYPWIERGRTLGDTFRSSLKADFPRMLLVLETSDVGFGATRVFELRRAAGDRWELRETSESWGHRRRYLEEAAAHLASERAREELSDPSAMDWKPFGNWGALEAAYQLYLTRAAEIAKIPPLPAPIPRYQKDHWANARSSSAA